jgi:hypothetical protein
MSQPKLRLRKAMASWPWFLHRHWIASTRQYKRGATPAGFVSIITGLRRHPAQARGQAIDSMGEKNFRGTLAVRSQNRLAAATECN